MHRNRESRRGEDGQSDLSELPTDSTVALSLDEAGDLLRKFQTETAQVQAIFTIPDGPSSMLRGILCQPGEDRYWSVRSEQEANGSALSFDLLSAIDRRFGDESSMPADAAFPFRFRYASALRFDFEDGSRLSIFELQNDQNQSSDEMAC